MKRIFQTIVSPFKHFDSKLTKSVKFFFKHGAKNKFMIKMSKKLQKYGLERLYLSGPKAFIYFVLFYLVRDVFLYIIIPIWFASLTD